MGERRLPLNPMCLEPGAFRQRDTDDAIFVERRRTNSFA
jgi:hypothetical protein